MILFLFSCAATIEDVDNIEKKLNELDETISLIKRVEELERQIELIKYPPVEKTLEARCKRTWKCMDACSKANWALCYRDCAKRNSVSEAVASPNWECAEYGSTKGLMHRGF